MAQTSKRFAESRGKHDHKQCVSRALSTAEKICKDRELQLTSIRRRVLELIWARHAPIGAYDILGLLKESDGHLAPPTVYRALDFLLNAGLIHRIDALNAFIACESPESPHAGVMLVCDTCNQVQEIDDPSLARLLAQKAKDVGFAAKAQSLELKGQCVNCARKSQ
jgi:Fur family zinc uptake transcriptional regulator